MCMCVQFKQLVECLAGSDIEQFIVSSAINEVAKKKNTDSNAQWMLIGLSLNRFTCKKKNYANFKWKGRRSSNQSKPHPDENADWIVFISHANEFLVRKIIIAN